MKRLAAYSGIFTVFCIGFILCYYFSYQNALKEYNARAQERNEDFLASLLQNSDDSVLSELGLQRTASATEQQKKALWYWLIPCRQIPFYHLHNSFWNPTMF